MQHDQALHFQLPQRGVQPADVRVVVMTHLHIDHASAVSEFPQATFVVDGREWAAAAGGGALRGYHTRQFDHAFDWRSLDYGTDSVESFVGFARSIDEIAKTALRLLTDRQYYQQTVAKMEAVASQRLSFEVVAKELEDFFQR